MQRRWIKIKTKNNNSHGLLLNQWIYVILAGAYMKTSNTFHVSSSSYYYSLAPRRVWVSSCNNCILLFFPLVLSLFFSARFFLFPRNLPPAIHTARDYKRPVTCEVSRLLPVRSLWEMWKLMQKVGCEQRGGDLVARAQTREGAGIRSICMIVGVTDLTRTNIHKCTK